MYPGGFLNMVRANVNGLSLCMKGIMFRDMRALRPMSLRGRGLAVMTDWVFIEKKIWVKLKKRNIIIKRIEIDKSQFINHIKMMISSWLSI
jgi:hypothetical protein